MEKVRTLTVAATQEHLSQQLMNELREVIQQDKYTHLFISTLIGVLEMVKMDYRDENRDRP